MRTRLRSLAGARVSVHSTSCTPGKPARRQAVRAAAARGAPARTGTALLPEDSGAQVLQVRAGRLARIGKEQHVEHAVVGQRLLRDRQFQQRGLELVVRFVGQDGLRLRGRLQLLGDRPRGADQVGVVGNVGDDARPRRLAAGTGRRRQSARGPAPGNCPDRPGRADGPGSTGTGRVVSSRAFSSRMARDRCAAIGRWAWWCC